MRKNWNLINATLYIDSVAPPTVALEKSQNCDNCFKWNSHANLCKKSIVRRMVFAEKDSPPGRCVTVWTAATAERILSTRRRPVIVGSRGGGTGRTGITLINVVVLV